MDRIQLNQLERLQKLRSAGALSDEEFNQEKKQLLDPQWRPGKSPRWLLYAASALVIVAAAIGLGLWSAPDRDTQVQHTRTEQPRRVQALPLPEVLSRPSDPRSPAVRLSEAFFAATGHRTQFSVPDGPDITTTRPLRIIELPFGPALLTQTETKDGCHACSGYIGLHYLREANGRTSVLKSWPKAVQGWGWGAAPRDWSITDKFTAYPAIYASGGYTGQGVTESSATITELRPQGPITSDVVHTGYTNEGAITDGEGVCTVDGKISNVRKDQSFDVIITGSVRAVDRYAKRNGKFVPVSKVDWDMHCDDSP